MTTTRPATSARHIPMSPQIATIHDNWDESLADRVSSVTIDDSSFSEEELEFSLDLIIVAEKLHRLSP